MTLFFLSYKLIPLHYGGKSVLPYITMYEVKNFKIQLYAINTACYFKYTTTSAKKYKSSYVTKILIFYNSN